MRPNSNIHFVILVYGRLIASFFVKHIFKKKNLALHG